MKRYALIGNGFIGKKHIEAISAVGGELVAVCDIDETKRVDGIPFFTDYKIAIEKADIISIATPNDTHTTIVLEASRAGKTIICEKPITFSFNELELMKRVPKLYGMFQLRKLKEISEMRKLAKEATFAELVVEMKRSNSYHSSWKGDVNRTGGLLINIGTHYFDIIGHLFGYDNFISQSEKTETKSEGILIYPNISVKWRIELTDEKPQYERSLSIQGKKFDLVQKENLHIDVYEDVMWGHGTTVSEEEKILNMISIIKK